MTAATTTSGTWVGAPMPRLEDGRLLTGRGQFLDDLETSAKTHHAAVVRSPHPHANIQSIDASAALQLPGVVGVVTGEDFTRLMRPFPIGIDNPPDYYPIAIDRVRYVGEPVAVVVAKNRYIAEDAVDLVNVEYEALEAVVDPEQAAQPGAPLLHDHLGTNVVVQRKMRFGDPDTAFADADFVMSGRFSFPKYASTPLETYGIIADWDPSSNAYTVWSNFHGPFSMHTVTATALKVPTHHLRFQTPKDIGGGFGIKTSIFPNIAMVAVTSRALGVRVKWIEDRHEHLLNSSSGTDRISYCDLAFKNDGTLVGYRQRWYDNVGGYIRAPEPGCSFRSHGNFTGPYKVRDCELDANVVVTNKSLTGPNRGYGCQELYFPIERLMDKAATRLDMDPAEIRRKNLITPDQMPYTTPTGGVYDAGDYPAVFDKAVESIDYKSLRKEQERARAEGKLFGIGFGIGVDPSVSNMGYVTIAFSPETRAKPGYKQKGAANEVCQIMVDPLGKVTVVLNTCPEGQGHETVAAQIVADELGVDPREDILVVTEMDTASRLYSITAGSYSSRFASVTSSAIVGAARMIRDKALRVAAHSLDVPTDAIDVVDGDFVVRDDPERRMKFRHVAGQAHWDTSSLPEGESPGLHANYTFSFERAGPPDEHDRVQSSQAYGFVAELIAIEIDPETYELTFRRFVSSHDAGRVLNPLVIEGQVYGAATHAIGGALYEELAYDDEGHPLAVNFADYLCPSSAEVPNIELVHADTPSPWTTLGSKGSGEASSETVPVAIANAVADALAPLGADVTELPITAPKLWKWVQEAKQEVGDAQ